MRSWFRMVGVLPGLLCSACTTTPALHVIGVYEGQKAATADDQPAPESRQSVSISASGESTSSVSRRQNPPPGEVRVDVSDDSRPMVLALMAYNRTLWRVSLKPGVQLTKVILGGYYTQQVTGIPPDIPIETYTYESSPCEHCWQGAHHFYSDEEPPKELRDETGLEVSSFQGRYHGTEFHIFPGIKAYRNGRPALCRPGEKSGNDR